jgi:hypothetical protein
VTAKVPEQVYVLPEHVHGRPARPGTVRNRCYRLLMEHYEALPTIPSLAAAFDGYLAEEHRSVLRTKQAVAVFRAAAAAPAGQQPLFEVESLVAHAHPNSQIKANVPATDLHRVWLHLAARRLVGATSSEVERALGLAHQSASSCLHSLQAAGEAVALLESR